MSDQPLRPVSNVTDSRIPKSTQQIDHSDEVASSVAALYGNSQLSDVTFLVDGVRFTAHRVILAARSEYFRALLYGGLSESSSSVIHLNDISAVAFRHVLEYAYTGRLNVRKIRILLDVLGLAHQYGFQSLESALSNHLTHSLLPSNVWLIYNLAVLYNLEDLINACLTFLDAIAPAPLHSPLFLTLSQTAVERLLSRSSFCASEIEIFRSLCAWFRAHRETPVLEEDAVSPASEPAPAILSDVKDEPEGRHSRPGSALCQVPWPGEPIGLNPQHYQMMRTCVRFELMSLTDLLTEVRASKLVSSDDLLDAIGRRATAAQDLPYRGWLLPETNLATTRFACSLVAGEAGTYPHFFVDDEDDGNAAENTQQEFRINLTNPHAFAATDSSAEEDEDEEEEEEEQPIESSDDASSSAALAKLMPAVGGGGGPTRSAPGHLAGEPSSGSPASCFPTSCAPGLTQNPIRIPARSTVRPSASRMTTTSAVRAVQPTLINSRRSSALTGDQFAQLGSSTVSGPGNRDPTVPRWLHASRNNAAMLAHSNQLPPPPPHSEHDVVRHSLDDPDARIVIRLGKPSLVNTIRMQLWDREARCYSYYVEVSLDQTAWFRVVDYRSHLCRSWQTLHFPTRVIRYVRVTGTRNTSNRAFHLVTFRCLYTEHMCKQLNGFLIPSYNVASVDHGATVLEGVSRTRNALIDGGTRLYDWNSGYTCHQLGNGSIVVQLAQPYLLRSMRFLLWDLDDRFYSYSVHVSTNREDWRLVHDARRDRCQSWQVLTFPLQLVTFIRVVGSYNTANEVFHMVHLECPYPPAEAALTDADDCSDAVMSTFAADLGPPGDHLGDTIRQQRVCGGGGDGGPSGCCYSSCPPSSDSSLRGSCSMDFPNISDTVERREERTNPVAHCSSSSSLYGDPADALTPTTTSPPAEPRPESSASRGPPPYSSTDDAVRSSLTNRWNTTAATHTPRYAAVGVSTSRTSPLQLPVTANRSADSASANEIGPDRSRLA